MRPGLVYSLTMVADHKSGQAMARRRLPTLERRTLLHAPGTPKARLLQWAEALLEEGSLYEALDFFERARDTAGLERVRDAAIAEGNAHLLAWIQRNSLCETSPVQWLQTGENAAKSGKFLYAVRAFEKANQPARAAEVRRAAGLPEPGDDKGNKQE